jgi:hypothetical protein
VAMTRRRRSGGRETSRSTCWRNSPWASEKSGGRLAGGWGRESDIGLGATVAAEPAGALLLDSVVFVELSLVGGGEGSGGLERGERGGCVGKVTSALRLRGQIMAWGRECEQTVERGSVAAGRMWFGATD